MSLGKNRSPYQNFGRSTFEPQFSDKDLLPKPTVVRASKERQPYGPDREFAGGTRAGRLKAAGPGPFPDDLFSAADIEGLPWTRRRGDEWTDATFRALVLDFLRQFFRDRPTLGLVGWDVEERANGDRMGSVRLPARLHYLRFGVLQRVGDDIRRVESALSFDLPDRVSPQAEARLALILPGLDVQLANT